MGRSFQTLSFLASPASEALAAREELIRLYGDVPPQEADVIGQVVGIHVSEDIVRDGRIDMSLARPIARMGYRDYADGGSDVFEMTRPGS